MTTIAACLELGIMAADSRGTLYSLTGEQMHAYQCSKLLRIDGWIVGCAGDQDDIDNFMIWMRDRRKKRKPVEDQFAALMLSRNKLFHVADDTLPEEMRVGYMAIGSGGGLALAAMAAMSRVGVDPDPRIAVDVACEHDPNSGLPIDFLTWKLK